MANSNLIQRTAAAQGMKPQDEKNVMQGYIK